MFPSREVIFKEWNSWSVAHGYPPPILFEEGLARRNPAWYLECERRETARIEKIVRMNREAVLTRL